MLEIIDLNVSFKEKKVIQELNIKVENGEVFGILGKNGAGKTTLFNSIYQNTKYSGTILFGAGKLNRNTVSFVETESYFYPYMLAKEYVELFKTKTSVSSIINRFDIPLDKYIDTFSTGMKKKLAIIGAVLLDKPIIILDEPFNGLDFESVEHLYELILDLKQSEKITLISSHILETLTNTCDRIGILKNGKITSVYDKHNFSELILNKKNIFEL